MLTSGGCVLFLGWLLCPPVRQHYRQTPPAAKWVLPHRELTLTRQPAWRRLRGPAAEPTMTCLLQMQGQHACAEP